MLSLTMASGSVSTCEPPQVRRYAGPGALSSHEHEWEARPPLPTLRATLRAPHSAGPSHCATLSLRDPSPSGGREAGHGIFRARRQRDQGGKRRSRGAASAWHADDRAGAAERSAVRVIRSSVHVALDRTIVNPRSLARNSDVMMSHHELEWGHRGHWPGLCTCAGQTASET